MGGVAGSAQTVTDCVSVVDVNDYTEKVGAIIGAVEEWTEITGNYYLVSGKDLGAVDGISYDEVASALRLEALLALEGIPEEFAKNKVEFLFEDGSIQTVLLTPGENLAETDIPALPQKEGYRASWEGMDSLIVNFDKVYQIKYTELETIIESKEKGDNNRPLLLVEGKLKQNAEVSVAESTATCIPAENQTMVKHFMLLTEGCEGTLKVRYQLPKEYDSEYLHLFVWKNNQWQKMSFEVDGSYMVFDAEAGNTNIAILYQRTFKIGELITAGAAALLFIIILIVLLVRGGKKRRALKAAKKSVTAK